MKSKSKNALFRLQIEYKIRQRFLELGEGYSAMVTCDRFARCKCSFIRLVDTWLTQQVESGERKIPNSLIFRVRDF